VWSVWRERVEVYIGTGTVLVRRHGHSLLSFEHPATLPLNDVLARVDAACAREKGRSWSLHVWLSAALCPPVAFSLPNGVRRRDEVMALAQASAAASWGVPADEAPGLVCVLDMRRNDLAAAMMAGARNRIAAWAALHGGRLASLQPLWAAAASAPGCRPKAIRTVTVHEPDANIVVSDAGSDTPPTESAALKVRFSSQSLPLRQQWTLGPDVWRGHWELLA
jgi:hypothetical protein